MLGERNALPLLLFFCLERSPLSNELLNRHESPDLLNEIQGFANDVEIAPAVFRKFGFLGDEDHGVIELRHNRLVLVDLFGKRFAKAQDGVERNAIFVVVGSHVHAQECRIMTSLELQNLRFRNR